MTIKGLKGLSTALNEFSQKIGKDIAERTMTSTMQQAKTRLNADTPVITGRLQRSTVVRKEGPGKQTLGQFAPYANIVNNRRGYWQGAVDEAQKWPNLYAQEVKKEWDSISRKHAGK